MKRNCDCASHFLILPSVSRKIETLLCFFSSPSLVAHSKFAGDSHHHHADDLPSVDGDSDDVFAWRVWPVSSTPFFVVDGDSPFRFLYHCSLAFLLLCFFI
ncbi:hypothetical protein AAZX31_13G205400 [Glycine max]